MRPIVSCPRCGAKADRLQRSMGVYAVYPCQCWISPDAATEVARSYRVLVDEMESTQQ